MALSYAALWKIIQVEPYASMTAENCAAALNAQTAEKPQPISSAELLAWAGAEGRYARIEAAAASENGALRSVAAVAMGMLTRDGTQLDLSLPDRAAMLGALVAAGVLTAADQACLEALAVTMVSPAQAAGLGTVKVGHVTQARHKGDDDGE